MLWGVCFIIKKHTLASVNGAKLVRIEFPSFLLFV